MNCTNCEANNSNDALYCQRCGNRLNTTNQIAHTIPAETPPSPPSQYQIAPTEKADLSSSPYTAYGSAPPPPPYVPSLENPYATPSPVYPISTVPPVGSTSITPTRGKGRGILWIVLALVLVVSAGIFIYTYLNRSTSTKTVETSCNGLQSGDFQSAYNLFISDLQR